MVLKVPLLTFYDFVILWPEYQACQSWKNVWMLLLVIWFPLGSPVRSRVLDSTILMGPFQSDVFYDSFSVSSPCQILMSFTNNFCYCQFILKRNEEEKSLAKNFIQMRIPENPLFKFIVSLNQIYSISVKTTTCRFCYPLDEQCISNSLNANS